MPSRRAGALLLLLTLGTCSRCLCDLCIGTRSACVKLAACRFCWGLVPAFATQICASSANGDRCKHDLGARSPAAHLLPAAAHCRLPPAAAAAHSAVGVQAAGGRELQAAPYAPSLYHAIVKLKLTVLQQAVDAAGLKTMLSNPNLKLTLLAPDGDCGGLLSTVFRFPSAWLTICRPTS